MGRVIVPSYTLVPPVGWLLRLKRGEYGGRTHRRILDHLKVPSPYEDHDCRRELLLRRQLFQRRDHLLALEAGHLQMRPCEHAHHVEDVPVYKHTSCLFLFLLGNECQDGCFVHVIEGRVGEGRLGI